MIVANAPRRPPFEWGELPGLFLSHLREDEVPAALSSRVIVFIDSQNAYQGARGVFFRPTDHHACGQLDPLKLGRLICSKVPAGDKPLVPRELEEVRVYTGRPDSTKDPKSYGAHMRQCSVWERNGVIVRARALRYPPGWPAQRAEEKGVDVALAIDFVALAFEEKYDVGVIVSTDTDLRPALEYVTELPNVSAETAAWCDSTPRGLTLPGRHLWCHRLRREDFDAVADYTDYNRHLR